jgi:hypothetical protein
MPERFDVVTLAVTKTPEGFIHDSPILTRTGVFPYRRADGSIQMELRPADEVFHADSLASLMGKPITDGHAVVTSQTARGIVCGAVLSKGRQDGENVRADVVIHDTSPVDRGNKEISLGYTLDLDPTPGDFNGTHYDAIQRNIRVNHMALVKRGRAGNSRLNLDAADAAGEEEETTMTTVKVRLDTGLSYDAAPEVANELEAIRVKLAEATKRGDTEAARADSEKARADAADAKVVQARKDGEAEAMTMLALQAEVKGLGVTVTPAMTPKDLRVAGIKAVRGDSFPVDGKTDEYIAVAYDMAIADKATRTQAVAGQRADMSGSGGGSGSQGERQDSKDGPATSSAQARERMIAARTT